jgi:Cd2+/Zn2+-exporting ATPase/Cu+-exporting ATPase
VDAVGASLAACGFPGLLLAAFVHVASELAFILNSVRLLAADGRWSASRRPNHDAVRLIGDDERGGAGDPARAAWEV